MAKKQKHIISSTHLDSQGFMMTKEALESMLPQLNGERKPRLGLEHIRTFPPYGVIMNGKIVKGKDNYHYLTADNCFYDNKEKIRLTDGTELIREYFEHENYPFIECKEQATEDLVISTDPANFEKPNDISEINQLVTKESGIEFEQSLIGRKSELPDAETIVKITSVIATTIGIVKTKIPEKIGEAIADDVVKFYKLISTLAIETIKRAKPANRPKTFVIYYPNDECSIELVISTTKADKVLESLQKDKLQVIEPKMKLLQELSPEKIQFVYNENDIWEFNYLLSKDGSSTGIEKSFKKRNQLYKEILRKQEDRNGENKI